MAKYVISSLTADQRYVGWIKSSGINMVDQDHDVLVRGGAGLVRAAGGTEVYTPDGVRTEVTDEQAEFLAQHPHFQFHQKRGHVKIVDRAQEPNKAASDLEKDDGSAPKTQADVEKDASAKDAGDGSPKLQVTSNKK